MSTWDPAKAFRPKVQKVFSATFIGRTSEELQFRLMSSDHSGMN